MSRMMCDQIKLCYRSPEGPVTYLTIDFQNKVYLFLEDMPKDSPPINFKAGMYSYVEVKRKSELYELVEFLKENRFFYHDPFVNRRGY